MADVTTLIEQDHRKVERVFDQLKKAEEPAERMELLTRLHHLLEPHTKAEEAILYPAMESAKVESLNTSSATEEHDHVAKLLEDLRNEGPEAEAFGQKIDTIEAAVKHHVEEEEGEMLPEFRRKSDAATRTQLGSAFEQDELERLKMMGGEPAEVLVDLTKDELSQLAADKGIEGRSTMSKDELISAIAAVDLRQGEWAHGVQPVPPAPAVERRLRVRCRRAVAHAAAGPLGGRCLLSPSGSATTRSG